MRNRILIVGAGEIGMAILILDRLMSKMEEGSEINFVNYSKKAIESPVEPVVLKFKPTMIHQAKDYIEFNRKSKDQVWKKKWKR